MLLQLGKTGKFRKKSVQAHDKYRYPSPMKDDLGYKLRRYRHRMQMKQQTLAELLDVSQGYLSRLETGQAVVEGQIAEKIGDLLSRPEGQPADSHIANVVKSSPHFVMLLEQSGDGLRIKALSRTWEESSEAPMELAEGQLLDRAALADAGCQIHRLMGDGIFQGRIAAAETVWDANGRSPRPYWREILVPVMQRANSWLLHLTMVPIEKSTREALVADWGDTLSWRSFEAKSVAG